MRDHVRKASARRTYALRFLALPPPPSPRDPHAVHTRSARVSDAVRTRDRLLHGTRYDRGILDVAAFLPREQWAALAEFAPSQPRPMDWYSAVVHLVSAADGAVREFSREKQRSADKEEALRIDRTIAEVRVREVARGGWAGKAACGRRSRCGYDFQPPRRPRRRLV